MLRRPPAGCRGLLHDRNVVAVEAAVGAFSRRSPASCRARQGEERQSKGRYSALAPENLTTLAHFSVSSAMILPKSAGEPTATMPPRSAIRALNLGSASAALTPLLMTSMISAGVPLGAPIP